MSSEAHERSRSPTPAVLLAVLIVVGIALRFWRLGNWDFEATEIFTLRDSISPRLTNPRPLLYLLNYYVVRPFVPLDELGLRLLPAVFGVLAIPAFYLVGRRLVGTRAALFGTLLLTVSGLHVFYSQFARYWSLVFLLTAIYPYTLYLGIHERNRRALILGIVTAVLAVLAHPISVLLVGGLVLWILLTYLKRDQVVRLWRQKTVRWVTALLVVIVAVSIAVLYIPLLRSWISEHDRAPESGQFLLHLPASRGVKQIIYLLTYVESLTIPVVLSGIIGIYLLWQGRNRSLALLLACLAVFPMAFLVLLSFRAPVSTYYLVPTAPIFFIGAGVFLDHLSRVDWGLRPAWLVPTTVTAIILAAGAPTLISQYRDGRRYDFRSVAQWLGGQLAPGDVVFSDQPRVLAHYLPGTDVQRLRGDPAPLRQSVRVLHESGGGAALWIVVPAPSHPFRTNPKLDSLNAWMYDYCQLRNTIGVGRLDFRQYYLQIYRCRAAVLSVAGANSK